MSELAGPAHTGEGIRASAQDKAERILREELERLGWRVEDLLGRRKGGGRKVKIAARLRRETTMTLAWIAERLHMGAPGHVSCLLYRNAWNADRLANPSGSGESENKWFFTYNSDPFTAQSLAGRSPEIGMPGRAPIPFQGWPALSFDIAASVE